MRICHVVEAGAGGVGNVILDLVKHGIQAGDNITVIHGDERTWPQFAQGLDKMGVVKRIISPMRRSVGAHDFAAALKLYSALRQNGPFDVIHAHSSKAGALVRLLHPILPKSVSVYTPHAFVTLAPDVSPAYGWIEKYLSFCCNAIICLSRQEQKHAQAHLHIPARKLVVIPNGIDIDYPTDRAAARAKMRARGDEFVVGFIGRMEPQKNPARAIEAFAMAANQKPDMRLVMVGHGSLQAEVEQLASSKGLKERVTFIDDRNGRDLVSGFDCLLCSADYEGFSLVVLEAMAAGVPVVMTPVGGSEAVISGKTGIVTNDFSAAELSEGLVKLASNDAAQRTQMSVDAKVQAGNYSLEKMAQRTRTLYSQLLQHKHI